MNSPIVSSAEMRAAEKTAFERDVSAETLMDQAGAGIVDVVKQFFPQPGRCIVFAGKGNNGGDAIVAATELRQHGWQTELRLAYPEADGSELLRKKLARWKRHPSDPSATERKRRGHSPLIILDGLLGLGSKPPLREPILSGCRQINYLRQEEGAYVFAVDLPSGLDGDTGEADENCVTADFTVTIGAAKRGLVADKATNFVGRLALVPLANLLLAPTAEELACADSLRRLLPRRDFNAYKNQFGRVGIVAGSRGLIGASILCAEGALRAGAGLVRVFVLEDIYSIVASAAPAEAMIQPVESYRDLNDQSVAVWAIGPGLGQTHAQEIRGFVEKAQQPMVIDADGLNVLSGDTTILKRCAAPRLLTPHPGEMKRLTGNIGADAGSRRSNESRKEIATKFTREFPVTLLLKGSRTIVAEGGERISYNTTGNPGMATGGMGDVLTGVCAGLVGQQLSLFDAARLGAWICGRAAEIALFTKSESEQSLLPRDVLTNLGAAFNEIS